MLTVKHLEDGGCALKVLLTAIVTAIIAVPVTWFAGLMYNIDRFGTLIRAECPHLILEPDHPERSFIDMKDGGYIPIMPKSMQYKK